MGSTALSPQPILSVHFTLCQVHHMTQTQVDKTLLPPTLISNEETVAVAYRGWFARILGHLQMLSDSASAVASCAAASTIDAAVSREMSPVASSPVPRALHHIRVSSMGMSSCTQGRKTDTQQIALGM